MVVLIILAAGSPWIVGIAIAWRHRVRDGYVPPSMADRARKRLWI